MITFYQKIQSISDESRFEGSVDFSEPEIPNPLGGDNAREFVPLWLQLLPENSEEVKLPEEVRDAVYSPEGESYPSIDYDPRAGFFERADARSQVLAEKLGAMSLQHYTAYEAASLSNDEEEYLSGLDKPEPSSAPSGASSSVPAAESAPSDSAKS